MYIYIGSFKGDNGWSEHWYCILAWEDDCLARGKPWELLWAVDLQGQIVFSPKGTNVDCTTNGMLLI